MKPVEGSKKFTAEQKEEARARILAKLIERGESVEGSWEEIRAELGLDDIDIPLFKSSCWHLRDGDTDPDHRSYISVRPGEGGGNGMSRPRIIKALKRP